MKKHWKIIILMVILLAATLILSSCGERKTGNRITGGSDVQTFTYAYIVLDGQEIVRGAITQWRDYDNSDVVQLLMNGKYYLTHYSNVVMIADPELGVLDYSNVSWQGVHE